MWNKGSHLWRFWRKSFGDFFCLAQSKILCYPMDFNRSLTILKASVLVKADFLRSKHECQWLTIMFLRKFESIIKQQPMLAQIQLTVKNLKNIITAFLFFCNYTVEFLLYSFYKRKLCWFVRNMFKKHNQKLNLRCFCIWVAGERQCRVMRKSCGLLILDLEIISVSCLNKIPPLSYQDFKIGITTLMYLTIS